MNATGKERCRPQASPQAEALSWFVRLRGLPGPAPADRAAFAAWIGADAAHAGAYAGVEAAWEASAAPAAAQAEADRVALQRLLARMESPRSVGAGRQGRGGWRRVPSLLFGLAVLVLAVFGLWRDPFLLWPSFAADHQTARGEQREVALADGSRVILDAQTALAVSYAEDERRVSLLRGRAFFTVIHDGRPFTVDTPDGTVRVLGTRFEVDRQDHALSVTVAEGHVVVRGANGPAVDLTAGQRLRLEHGVPGAVQAADPAAAAAWRGGRLVFQGVALGEVVTTIGRYHPGHIVILNDSLAARPVSGTFATADPAGALEALRSVLGFQVLDLGGRLVFLR